MNTEQHTSSSLQQQQSKQNPQEDQATTGESDMFSDSTWHYFFYLVISKFSTSASISALGTRD
jgi:hypothetical protein